MPTQAADVRRLCQALRVAKATDLQLRMAAILLAVNGIDNALEFVHGQQAQPAQPTLFLDDTPRINLHT